MPVFSPGVAVVIDSVGSRQRLTVASRSVRVRSSRQKPIDQATVTLPLHPKLGLDTFRAGDPITIRMRGVNDDESDTFVGFITTVGPNLPVTLTCADAAWLLSRKYFDSPKVWAEPMFDDVVRELCDAADLPGLITDNSVQGGLGNGGQLKADAESYLDRIVQIASYDFRTDFFVVPGTKTPYYGLSYQPELLYLQQEVPVLRFDRCVTGSKLEYQAGDRVGKVVVHSHDESWSEDTDIAAEYGDGEPVEHVNERVDNAAEAATRAEEIFHQRNQAGYTGSLTVLGMPSLRHGMVVKLYDPRYPYRTGRYYLDAVEHQIDGGRYRTKLSLGSSWPVSWREKV